MNVFIANIINDVAFLREDECWHCYKVLRKKIGDEIFVIDGKEKMWLCTITFLNEKKCEAKLLKEIKSNNISNNYLHVAIAPTKQLDRIEWFLEKAVEIGINEVTFLKCTNSERVNIKLDRVLKIVESAVKQSLRVTIPKINDLIDFNIFLNLNHNYSNLLIAHCANLDKKPLKTFDFKNNNTLFCIGPEGDFSENEINLANEKKYHSVSLGDARLRTETAGLYVVQAVKMLSE